MNKKYIQIEIEKTPVVIAEVKECDPVEFLKKKKAAAETLERIIGSLLGRIEKLEKEVCILKGED